MALVGGGDSGAVPTSAKCRQVTSWLVGRFRHQRPLAAAGWVSVLDWSRSFGRDTDEAVAVRIGHSTNGVSNDRSVSYTEYSTATSRINVPNNR